MLKYPIIALLFVLFGAFVPGCKASFTDPLSGRMVSIEIGDNPSPEEAKELHKKLEEGVQYNLKAMRTANETANEGMFTCASENLTRGFDAKARLKPYMRGETTPAPVK